MDMSKKLPEGWRKYKLGDIATYINGKAFKPSEWREKGTPIVRIQNLTDENKPYNYYDKDDIPEKYVINNGDILISWSASLGVFEWSNGYAFLNQHIFKVVFDKMDINKKYFVYIVRAKLSEMERHTHGSTMKHITKGNFDNISINLPPLEEQERIASILEKAENAIEKREESIKLLDEYLKSVFVDMFGDPVTNPKGWKKSFCNEITLKIGSGSTPKGGNSSYKEEGISLIRSMNVHNNKFIKKDLAFIDDEQAKKLKNVTIEANDILLNITGASVARCCIVPNEYIPARVNQHVAIIRCKNEEILPTFLSYQLTNKSYQRLLWDIATSGGATREAITKQQIENLELIIPEIELQNKFDNLANKVDKLKTEMENILKELENNFNSLMQKAFNGEL